MSASTVWKIIEDRFATLQTDGLTCQVDLRHPNRGLLDIKLAGKPLVGLAPLQISATPPLSAGEQLEEAYVRGGDLVATYQQGPGRSARPQVYWRYLNHREYGDAVEVLVSMQTDYLASDPRVYLSSEILCSSLLHLPSSGSESLETVKIKGESLELSPQDSLPLLLARGAADAISYGEVIHPSDFAGAQVRRDGDGFRVEYQLFTESLEKGVIRRGRALGLFVSSSRDEEGARYWYRQLEGALPPLTT